MTLSTIVLTAVYSVVFMDYENSQYNYMLKTDTQPAYYIDYHSKQALHIDDNVTMTLRVECDEKLMCIVL